MWYKIDYDKLALLLLPTFLRRPILFAYIRSLIAPIATLYYQWAQMRSENIRTLSYNGQKCYLRKALNDKFGNSSGRITISDTAQVSQDYLFTKNELQDVFLGVVHLEQDFNYIDGYVDFLVNVPEPILSERRNEITAMIDFYVLAGKSYKLIKI
ncbi:hypothetical protein SGQ83_01430 [Flavobacterium sp. Fl-318]|uniref:Uncharacterized protein n=1 Tax=Flavobacterium cupriresistens TaxID=2893885 RepID=A0ABU4R5Y7_9FLAO|nr:MULTISPECIES: hypothetical protein [unclassified Flavobacterium]MDX6187997.1 hypothetical protein [Flavobacterium sp. Fl-318]UFH42083.1 hypothetical protein LNP23_20020 [Flavobacterium sp. F-323]